MQYIFVTHYSFLQYKYFDLKTRLVWKASVHIKYIFSYTCESLWFFHILSTKIAVICEFEIKTDWENV